jgi:hypothetical protein
MIYARARGMVTGPTHSELCFCNPSSLLMVSILCTFGSFLLHSPYASSYKGVNSRILPQTRHHEPQKPLDACADSQMQSTFPMVDLKAVRMQPVTVSGEVVQSGVCFRRPPNQICISIPKVSRLISW